MLSSRRTATAARAFGGDCSQSPDVGPLRELVLDPNYTFVTRATAEAVLRRKDKAGLAIIASALAVADSHHSDWIHAAIVDVFGVFSSDRDCAVQLSEELARDTDDRVSAGAPLLLAALAEIEPVLRPA